MDEKNVITNEDFKNIKTPTLSLDAQGTFKDPFEAIRSFKENPVEEEAEAVASAGAVDESQLSEQERQQVEAFVNQIDITDLKIVDSYGANAQNNISSFSIAITNNTKSKEFGEIGYSLSELRSVIQNTTTTEKKGIFGLFQKGKQKTTQFISNYETAESSVKRIEKDLKEHQQLLTQDIYVFDQLYNMTLELYKELTMYIIAGKKAVAQARKTRLLELVNKARKTNDQLDVQLARDYENSCKRFENRIFDLETTRLVAIQMAPQIRLLQNANQEVVDRLRSDIINVIPTWRNQMVLALGITRSRRALDAQAAITSMTNDMFLKNAEMLKQGSIDAALASERSIIDVETLKKVNKDIISSINEVVKIHEEGAKHRQEAQVEMAKLEEELKQSLLNAARR